MSGWHLALLIWFYLAGLISTYGWLIDKDDEPINLGIWLWIVIWPVLIFALNMMLFFKRLGKWVVGK